MTAAIATMEKLEREQSTLYAQLKTLGAQLQNGLQILFDEFEIEVSISRQGSALCPYFMDYLPRAWHDIAENHDMEKDVRYRRASIEKGIYNFPLPTKQASISTSHTATDIERTLQATREVLKAGI